MVWVYPSEVSLGSAVLGGVVSVAIDQKADRLVVEYGDQGPHPVFIDAPERRTSVTIVREVNQDEGALVNVGDLATLTVRGRESASTEIGQKYAGEVVVIEVSHEFSRKGGLVQRVKAVGVSATGAAAPIVQSPG
jgi:hypothetical protein